MQQICWSPGVTLADIEKQVIQKAAQFYNNDVPMMCNALKITPRNLEKKLEQYENERLAEDKKSEERLQREEDFRMRARGIPISNQGYREL